MSADWCATHWFLSLVAERPPKVAVGFHPSASAEPSRQTISSQSDDGTIATPSAAQGMCVVVSTHLRDGGLKHTVAGTRVARRWPSCLPRIAVPLSVSRNSACGVGCCPFLMLPFVSAGRERPPPQRGIPMSAQAIGLGHGRNHQGVAPTGRPSSSFVIVDDVFRVGPIESRPVGAV